MDPWKLVAVSLLAILTAVLSAAEAAFFALSGADREALLARPTRSARSLRALLESPRRLVFMLQVAGELVLVGLTFGMASWVIEVYGVQRGWWTLVLAPPAVLLFCLLLPRAVASRYPRQSAAVLAMPLHVLMAVSRPMMAPVKWASEGLLGLLGLSARGMHRLEESEFKTLVDIGEEKGALREQERELIHNVFDFGDIVAGEVMTPRTEIVGFSITTSLEDILAGIREHRLSRVPIYKGNLDNVIGILYTKDLLALLSLDGARKRSLKELLRPVYFVPVTKKVDELFLEFQSQKIHMAIVVDEYGGVAGLVTMDDLLEELFGVMLDEHHVQEPEYERLEDGSFIVQAHMPLEDLCELLDVTIEPADDEVFTAGGHILAEVGTLPQEGTKIRSGQVEFTVEALDGTRMTRIRVRKVPGETGSAREDIA